MESSDWNPVSLGLHANGRNNNSQLCWDIQCIVGRAQPVCLCKPCVMSVRGPNNVGRAVQTDPTFLRYPSAITEKRKCWELLAEKFDRFQTLRNNTQQHPTTCNNRVCKRTQHVTSNNVGSCWSTMLRPVARSLTWGEKCASRANCCFSLLNLLLFCRSRYYQFADTVIFRRFILYKIKKLNGSTITLIAT